MVVDDDVSSLDVVGDVSQFTVGLVAELDELSVNSLVTSVDDWIETADKFLKKNQI